MAILNVAASFFTYDDLQHFGGSPFPATGYKGRYCNDSVFNRYPSNVVALKCGIRTDVWVSLAHLNTSSDETNGVVMEFRSGVTGVLRVIHSYGVTHADGKKAVKLQAWDGSAWVDLADSSATGGLFTTGEQDPIVAHAILGDAGSFLLKQSGRTLIDFSGDTLRSAETTFDSVRFGNIGSYVSGHMQWAIVADADPTGFIVAEQIPDANGALTEWDGGEPEIDDVVSSGASNEMFDGDIMAGDTAGLDATFTKPALHGDLAHGYEIKAVANVARVRKNGVAPDLQFLSRHGATNYAGSTITPGSAFAAEREIWNVNPATGAAWTVAEVDAREFGSRTV